MLYFNWSCIKSGSFDSQGNEQICLVKIQAVSHTMREIRMPETKNVPSVTEFFSKSCAETPLKVAYDPSFSCKLHICYVHSGKQNT